jgi:hypothetical protein
MTPPPAILLHPDDNILVCRAPIAEGDEIPIDGRRVVSATAIDIGHKIARRDLKAGDKIIKYGAPIGSAVADIRIGAHVHLHNIKSDYIATHTREAS